jgi:hypothetical protein
VELLRRAVTRSAAPPAWAAAVLLLALGGLGCGGGGYRGPGGHPLPGPGARLDPIYDLTVSFPLSDVISGGVTYHGILLDLAVTFEDATVRDADPLYRAPCDVVSVAAGGVPQTWSLPQPIVITGSINGTAFATDPFGGIRFGTANLVLTLDGTIEAGARRIEGTAELFGTAERGTFIAVRRRRYLVTGTDFQSSVGEAAMVEVRYERDVSVSGNLQSISSDPVARVEDGRPVVVNRLTFDNLQGLDPHNGFQTAFEHSTGNGSNPHDLVIREEEGRPVGYVTRYEPPYDDLGIFDLQDGSILGSIDLRPYATNPDGLPRPDQVLLLDGVLFVTLENIDRRFTTYGNGRLLVVDPASRQVLQVIDLAGQNPFESLVYSPDTGLVYVGLAGIFPGNPAGQSLTGGVEAIDPQTRRSLGLLVDDDDLGGNVSGVAVPGASRGYAVVSDSAFHNAIKAFDLTTGAVLGSIYDSADPVPDLEADGDGWLLLADQSFTAPRLLILDGDTGNLLFAVPLRLPPLSVAVMTRSL